MQNQAKVVKTVLITGLSLGLSLYIFIAIYIAQKAEFDNKINSDAAIVLGAKSFVDGKVNQCVTARVEHAVDLYKNGYVKKIIMSGGTDKKPIFNGTNEGAEMKKMALSYDENINPDDILVEGESTSTYENLIFSEKLMSQNQLNSAIIVTEPFHSPRAELTAKKLGLNYTISPTLTSPCWNNHKYFSKYFLREPLALIAYLFFGEI
jgi:uncharacterized SAM-binding protein YcdF (DUF218 family)